MTQFSRRPQGERWKLPSLVEPSTVCVGRWDCLPAHVRKALGTREF